MLGHADKHDINILSNSFLTASPGASCASFKISETSAADSSSPAASSSRLWIGFLGSRVVVTWERTFKHGWE